MYSSNEIRKDECVNEGKLVQGNAQMNNNRAKFQCFKSLKFFYFSYANILGVDLRMYKVINMFVLNI